jgi:GDP-L-fucose synthase
MFDISAKRVLVTGGNGFLGRCVCGELRRRSPLALIAPGSRDCDLRERDAVRKLLEDSRPDLVIHLAAVVGGIGANRRYPGKYFYDNAVMGIELLEAARAVGIEKYVQVGTICSYPKFTPVPFREEDLWAGYPEETNAPYGLAKKMLLVQAQAYRQQYGMNAVTLLPVNMYGPGDNFDLESGHVIPALIRKAIEARDSGLGCLDVWGTGSASREFLYVTDCAEAIIAAAERYDSPEPVNVGSGEEIRIRDLASLVCEAVGFHGDVRWDVSRPDGQPRRCLDLSRAKAFLGWEPRTGLREGLRKTVGWFEANRARFRAVA